MVPRCPRALRAREFPQSSRGGYGWELEHARPHLPALRRHAPHADRPLRHLLLALMKLSIPPNRTAPIRDACRTARRSTPERAIGAPGRVGDRPGYSASPEQENGAPWGGECETHGAPLARRIAGHRGTLPTGLRVGRSDKEVRISANRPVRGAKGPGRGRCSEAEARPRAVSQDGPSRAAAAQATPSARSSTTEARRQDALSVRRQLCPEPAVSSASRTSPGRSMKCSPSRRTARLPNEAASLG